MHISFFCLRINTVKFLFHTRPCKSSNRKNLSLSSGEYSRTVSSRNNADFTPDRTNLGRFSSVGSDSFIKNHRTHNFLFCSLKFFCNKVNAGFFNHFSDCVIFRKSINFFFHKFFSFFKFFLSVSSVKIMISINNHIVSSFVNNIFDFCCIVRVHEFFSYNAASFSKFKLSIALFSDFTLSKFNGSHNIVFRNEFTSGLNHNNAVVSTRNNDIQIGFVSLLVSRICDHITVFIS